MCLKQVLSLPFNILCHTLSTCLVSSSAPAFMQSCMHSSLHRIDFPSSFLHQSLHTLRSFKSPTLLQHRDILLQYFTTQKHKNQASSWHRCQWAANLPTSASKGRLAGLTAGLTKLTCDIFADITYHNLPSWVKRWFLALTRLPADFHAAQTPCVAVLLLAFAGLPQGFQNVQKCTETVLQNCSHPLFSKTLRRWLLVL